MKLSIVLIFFTLLFLSCNPTPGNNPYNERVPAPYVGPIIDMHVHAFSMEREGMFFGGINHPKTLRGQTFKGVATPEEQKQETLKKFREHNIVKAMVAGGEEWYDDAPEVILIGGGFKPLDELQKQFDEGKLHVIGELAPFYRGILADDPVVAPYFELAQKLGLPVGFHILPGGPNGGLYYNRKMLQGIRAYNANPLQIENVLIKHPDVKVYIMHGGWPYVEDMKALMYAHPQVYVDVAVINWILPLEEFHSFLRQLVQAGFGDRIMYGSDQMVWPQTIDIGIDAINSAPFLNMQQKEDIFYNNAARFLGLSNEEIAKHKSQ